MYITTNLAAVVVVDSTKPYKSTEFSIFKHDLSSQLYSVYNHVQFERSNAIFF